jgi:hypothetical protein
VTVPTSWRSASARSTGWTRCSRRRPSHSTPRTHAAGATAATASTSSLRGHPALLQRATNLLAAHVTQQLAEVRRRALATQGPARLGRMLSTASAAGARRTAAGDRPAGALGAAPGWSGQLPPHNSRRAARPLQSAEAARVAEAAALAARAAAAEMATEVPAAHLHPRPACSARVLWFSGLLVRLTGVFGGAGEAAGSGGAQYG